MKKLILIAAAAVIVALTAAPADAACRARRARGCAAFSATPAPTAAKETAKAAPAGCTNGSCQSTRSLFRFWR